MINRFLIACKRVTGLGLLPSLLIALWSGGAAVELSAEAACRVRNEEKSRTAFHRGQACMETTPTRLFVLVLWQLNMVHFHNSPAPNYINLCQTFYIIS